MTNVDSPSPIVVGVDGSTAAIRAAEWAIDEATSRGLALRLVHVAAFEELLLTTNTELKVMAPQAISGLSRPDATTAYLRGPRT